VCCRSGLDPSLYADMDAVAASETAMNAVAASERARNVIWNSSTAWSIVSASNIAIGKYVAAEAGLDPSAYADMDAVAASATARSAIRNSSMAWSKVSASSMAIGKFVAGAAGLNPADYADIDAVVTSEQAMDALIASVSARRSVFRSATAMDKIWGSKTAVKYLFILWTNGSVYGTQVADWGPADNVVNIYNNKAHMVRSTSTGHEWWSYPDFATRIKTLNQTYYEHCGIPCPDLDVWLATAFGDPQTQYILNDSDLSTYTSWDENVGRAFASKSCVATGTTVRAGSGVITQPTDPDGYTVFHTFLGCLLNNYQIAISYSGDILKRVWVYDVATGNLKYEHDFTADNIDISAIKRNYSPRYYSYYVFPMIGVIYNPPTDEYGFVYSDSSGIWIL